MHCNDNANSENISVHVKLNSNDDDLLLAGALRPSNIYGHIMTGTDL